MWSDKDRGYIRMTHHPLFMLPEIELAFLDTNRLSHCWLILTLRSSFVFNFSSLFFTCAIDFFWTHIQKRRTLHLSILNFLWSSAHQSFLGLRCIIYPSKLSIIYKLNKHLSTPSLKSSIKMFSRRGLWDTPLEFSLQSNSTPIKD